MNELVNVPITPWYAIPAAVGLLALTFAAAPGVLLHLGVLLFPKKDERRKQFTADLYDVPYLKRPFWVAGTIIRCLFEGLPKRVRAFRERGNTSPTGSSHLEGAAIGTPSNGGTLWPLVKALALLPCLSAARDRNFVVRLLADRLGTVLSIEESQRVHVHILNIVEVCERRSDGLGTLLDVVRELDEGTIYLREAERIVEERTALPLWPEEEREELFALLRGVIFPDFVELYRQVAGVGAPDLPAETSYREVFSTLETLNAEPDGLPKPIVFIELLADGRRSELSIELHRWADRQASRLGVITELQNARRERGPTDAFR